MEELMVKAIRKFKKEHERAEIRGCYASDYSGSFGDVDSATFCVEYVMSFGGKYEEYIFVSK